MAYLDPTNPLVRFSFKDLLLAALTFGQHYQNKMTDRQKQFEDFINAGDYDYWPFIDRNQYEQQLKNQPFLAGAKA